jgi:DNA-binding MarR family transcriptional regulator
MPANAKCGDALADLVQTLRAIQFTQGHHPWLLLGLTMAQLKAVMFLVQTGGMRSRELADGLGIAPSAATPLVDRLVKQKLARRDDDPDDRRIVRIQPTAKAVELHNELMQAHSSVLAEVLAEVPPGERDQVHRSVALLLECARRVLGKHAKQAG